jgi:hypothetical protein
MKSEGLNFESASQCSTVTGIPLDVLKIAKKEKVEGFDFHRIRIGPGFLKWYFSKIKETGEQLPEGFATWKQYNDMIIAKRNEIRLKKDAGTVLDKEAVERENAEAEGYYFSELERFQREAPSKLAGKNEIQIHDSIDQEFKQLRVRSREKFQKLPEEAKQ